jgi:hypothetical protein
MFTVIAITWSFLGEHAVTLCHLSSDGQERSYRMGRPPGAIVRQAAVGDPYTHLR